jgi:hypothetical protein
LSNILTQKYSADLAEKCRKALEVRFGEIPMPKNYTKSKAVKSKAVKSKAVKSKAVKSKAVKSKAVKSKAVKSKAVKSKAVKSKAVKKRKIVIKRKDINKIRKQKLPIFF